MKGIDTESFYNKRKYISTKGKAVEFGVFLEL